MEKKKFIFNDESITNSYRFRILTGGIKLGRFLANPVMLADHWNTTSDVIGKWEEIAVLGGQLQGLAIFDTEDALGKAIAGKVDRGFIKGCSMGVSYSRDAMEQQPDGSWLLKECELYEVSICAVPSNANSLRLYNQDTQKLMTDDEVKLSLSSFFKTEKTEKTDTEMEKVTLSVRSLVALGLNEQPTTTAELDSHIAKLASGLEAEKQAHEATKVQLANVGKEQAVELVKQANLSGKITESEVKDWEEMAKANYTLASTALAKLPVQNKLNADAKLTGDGSKNPKTPDEFEKLSSEAKLSFKTEYPDEYKALWK